MTPLVVAKKGNQVQNFYTNQEFENWSNKKSTNASSWNIEYKKGLAALEDDEYENIIKDPFVVQLKLDKESKESLEAWFGADSQPRKEKLLDTKTYESN
jgi:DNA gyrase/topoisomerase IV subunit B